MLTINSIENVKPNPLTFKINLNNRQLTIETTCKITNPENHVIDTSLPDSQVDNFNCGNTVQYLESYRTYGLMFGKFARREQDKSIYEGNIKLIDFCRINIASRETFLNIPDFWVHSPIGQVDTGLLEEDNPKIVFTIFGKYNSECEIISDIPIEYNTDLPPTTFQPHGSLPRFKLWDRYAISINGVEYQANQNGKYFNQEDVTPTVQTSDIVEIDIQKYTADFSQKLNRSIDAHEIVIESTCGILRSTRIDLANGRGKAYLHTLGHLGRFKLKIGLRWYPVWCEYNLQLV